MTSVRHLLRHRRRLAGLTALALVCGTATAYAVTLDRRDPERPYEQPPPTGAERRRAAAAAAEFARSCRPPCRVHSVERVARGVWRVRLNFESGYCVVLRLDEFRRTRRGTHEGWETTRCPVPKNRE